MRREGKYPMHRRSRTVVAVMSLALASSATAVAAADHWHHGPGRPSTTPPPHVECPNGGRPPCKVGHDDDHGHKGGEHKGKGKGDGRGESRGRGDRD